IVNFGVSNTSGGPAPVGNVVITVSGGAETCTGTVAAGRCSLALNNLGAPRTNTPTYSGNAQYNGSNRTGTPTGTKGDTTTPITTAAALGATATNPGDSFAVQWSTTINTPAAGTLTGTVTVTDGVDSCSGPVASARCYLVLNTPG